jgi:probable HAF family extracellular repeat protein
MATGATAINISGQIVGQYELSDNTWHGFVTSPITTVDFERPGCCRVASAEDGH